MLTEADDQGWYLAVDDHGLSAVVVFGVGEGKLLLGFADSGLLAAVALVRFLGSAGDTYVVKLAAVAVDRRCQRRGVMPAAAWS